MVCSLLSSASSSGSSVGSPLIDPNRERLVTGSSGVGSRAKISAALVMVELWLCGSCFGTDRPINCRIFQLLGNVVIHDLVAADGGSGFRAGSSSRCSSMRSSHCLVQAKFRVKRYVKMMVSRYQSLMFCWPTSSRPRQKLDGVKLPRFISFDSGGSSDVIGSNSGN